MGIVPAAIDAAAIEAQGLARIEHLVQARLPVLHAHVPAKLLGRLADDCLGGKSQGARDEGIHVQIAAVAVETRDAVLSIVRKRSEALLARTQRLLGPCARRDVESVAAHDGLVGGDQAELLVVGALAHDDRARARLRACLPQPLCRRLPVREPWVRPSLRGQVGEQPRGGRVRVAHTALHVRFDDGVRVVLGKGCDVGQLIHLQLELGIDRRQLLVGRVQLFVGRDKLLVRGLQLLVGRLQLLDGGTELRTRRTQRRLQLLDDGPIAFAVDLDDRERALGCGGDVALGRWHCRAVRRRGQRQAGAGLHSVAPVEGKLHPRWSRRLLATENAIFRVHGLEQVGAAGDALGRTQEQEAAWAKRAMEKGKELLLQLRAEIDEDIATGDEVELQEGWIPNQAVLGENAHVAQFAGGLVALPFADEKTDQAFGRHLFGDWCAIASLSRLGQHLRVEVGGEYLHARRCSTLLLAEQDRKRVRLLARGTAGDPDANWRGPVLHHSGQDLSGQDSERLGIAEELGHADQEILEQDRRLRGIAFQLLDVVRDRPWMLELNAVPDAAEE